MQLEHIIIQKDPKTYSAFPDIVRLRNGDLVVVFRETDFRGSATHIDPSSRIALMRSGDEGRTWPAEGHLYEAHSRDEGRTWEGLRNSGIWGHPAHLLQLQSGRLLCTYGHRREPFGVRASLSEDEGETWGKEIVLRDDGLHWDLGYPSSVQLEDGRILSVYYFHDAVGTRLIGGTFWQEEQAT